MRNFASALAFVASAIILCGSLVDAQGEKVVPAQFKKQGFFAGGKPLAGAILSGIRFGKHSDFLRVVFDLFQQTRTSTIGAPWHPPYKIEYKKYPYRFVITLEGVTFYERANIESENSLPLSIVTTPDNTIKVIQIFVNEPVLFKVIEIDDPAKLSLDIKKAGDEEIPRVYAVTLKNVDDVETAFEILESGKIPEGIDLDVLVIGNSVFVEAVFLNLDEAAETASILEKNGFEALITERMGNELPTL